MELTMPHQDSISFLESLKQLIEADRLRGSCPERLKKIEFGASILVNPNDEGLKLSSVFHKAESIAFLIPFLFQHYALPRVWLHQAILSWSTLQDKVFMHAFTKDKPLHDLTQSSYQTLIETDPFESLLHLNTEVLLKPPVFDLGEAGWLKDAFQDLNNQAWSEGFSTNARHGLNA